MQITGTCSYSIRQQHVIVLTKRHVKLCRNLNSEIKTFPYHLCSVHHEKMDIRYHGPQL